MAHEEIDQLCPSPSSPDLLRAALYMGGERAAHVVIVVEQQIGLKRRVALAALRAYGLSSEGQAPGAGDRAG